MLSGDEKLREYWAMITREMRNRGLSIRKVEEMGGVANAVLSRRIRHNLPPTEATYEAVEAVLGIPKRAQMEAAGEVPPPAMTDSEFDELYALATRMTPSELGNVLRYIEFQFPHLYQRLKEEQRSGD